MNMFKALWKELATFTECYQNEVPREENVNRDASMLVASMLNTLKGNG